MSETWRGVSEEEAVRKLLQDAGPRPALPEEDLGAIREAARAEWSRRYGSAQKRVSLLWLAVAAAVLAAVIGLAVWARVRQSSIAPTVASIERVSGNARWEVGRALAAGSVLATGSEEPARLALRMRGGASVRLDAATQVRLASATLIELRQGAVYVDTGAARNRNGEIAVRAPAGLFRPAGTQYEVRLESGATKLRVREGSVGLERGPESVRAGSGEELVVRGDGKLIRRPVAIYGPDWDWVGEAAPMLDIEGLKLQEFLSWIGRETGLRIELAGEKTASVAESCVLHGSIEHLTLADAPGLVLSSCGLGHRVSNGTFVVFAAEKKGR